MRILDHRDRKGTAERDFRAADASRDSGSWPDAAKHYAAGLARDPSAFPMWVQYGHALKETGDLPGAKVAYLRALALDASDADLHVHLGHLHRLLEEPDRAREHYTRAVFNGSDDMHATAGAWTSPKVVAALQRLLPEGASLGAHTTASQLPRSFAALILSRIA